MHDDAVTHTVATRRATWLINERHPQKRKYITYCIAARGGPRAMQKTCIDKFERYRDSLLS